MDRSRYHAAPAALVAGLLLAEAPGWAIAALALVFAAGFLVVRRRGFALACALLVLAGAAAGELRLRAIDGPSRELEAWARLDERAVLLERPRLAGSRTHATVRLRNGAKLLAVSDDPALWPAGSEPGLELRVRGLLKPPERAEGERFHWPAHLLRRGIGYELGLDEVEPAGRRGGWAGTLDAARRRAEHAVSEGLPREKAALLRGMVLGQDEAIDPLTKDDWRDSGLAHLLAVSGQNVMLLCALALPFLALSGASPRARIAVLFLLIALYVPLAGAGPSLQRAAVMGGAGLLALASSRPASAAYGLLLAAALTLIVNPRIAGDAGWQLSFAAVAGILAARPLAPRSALGGALAITVAATVATAPLLAFHFGSVPLVSIPANLAALPAVAPVMWVGMLDAALGQLPGGQVPAGALALVADPLLGYLLAVAHWFAAIRGAVVDFQPGVLQTVAAYAVLVVLVVAARYAVRRHENRLESARAAVRGLSLRMKLGLAAALAAGASLLMTTAGAPGGPARLTVSFLDVGQGDAVLIQHPDGSAVLFDGGRAEARVARLLTQAGVRRLALVVSTHQSADHHSGLTEVVRRFPVGTLLENGDGTRDPSYAELLDEAQGRGARVLSAGVGQRFQAGALTVEILWPEPRDDDAAPGDPNERAVIALVSSGDFDLLLSADAESPALAQVDLPDVEVMKVPHHGSADPGLAEQLERLDPEVAVIQVGENTYGHPAPSTLAALERAVPHVRRNDRDGTVRVEVTPQGLRVQP